MFGLGMSEIILLGVLALLLIGPQQLPEVARTIGRFINDLKRSADGLTDEIKKQARADLDLDFLQEKRSKADETSKPIPIWDPNKKKEEAPEHKPGPDVDSVPSPKIEPPDQMTFVFTPEKPDLGGHSENPDHPEQKNEKKD
ncbi:MAG: twin-arginine translocase TatA/TatE family subunit [Bdellovibrionaceae bacterium]|nr:twin-arginine translocase TatA/TatE family subunit [Pseudobdellovibrionaceae bacterium]